MHISNKCSIAVHCLIFIYEYGEEKKVTSELYIPLSVSMLHGHLVHGFRPLSASIPVC